MSRKKSVRVPDLRSRITHENASLGGGVDGSIAVSSFSRGTAGLPMPQQQAQQYQSGFHGGHAHTASNASVSSFAAMRGAPQQGQQQQQRQPPPAEQYGMPRSGSNDMLAPHSQQQQQHHLGAGPSFVSLSPSDSISNYEGRAGAGSSNAYGAPAHLGTGFEPSAASVASFAQAQDGGPIRPARSMRRPQGAPPLPAARSRAATSPSRHEAPAAPPAAGRNLLGGRGARPAATDRHATSARLMANMNGVDGASSGGEEDTFEDAEAYEDPRRARPREPAAPSFTSPTVGTLSKPAEPAALGSVLSALSAAGRKQGAQRILRGTTAEEESKRRKTERKVEDARAKESRPLESYVDRRDERAFRGINGESERVSCWLSEC
jgi:exocyst complex component 4